MSINIIEVVITHLRRIAASLPSKKLPSDGQLHSTNLFEHQCLRFCDDVPWGCFAAISNIAHTLEGCSKPLCLLHLRTSETYNFCGRSNAMLRLSQRLTLWSGWSPHRPGITGTDLRSPQDPSKGGARAARTEWVAGVFDEIILVANWCYEIHYFECVLLVVFAVARHEFYLLT